MNTSHSHLLMATALAAGLVVAAPLAVAQVRAEESATVPTNPGFKSSGQINAGETLRVPSSSIDVRKIPTPEEARAAKMMPASKDPLPGDGQPTGSATTGSGGGQQATQSGPGVQSGGDQMGPGSADKAGNEPGSSVPASAALTGSSGGGKGPIGAVGETIPAKFSQRNDILDRTPLMALPSGLTDQERQQIYQAVMADKSQPATDADALGPASELSTRQALNEMHELPASVKGIGGVSKLKFVKAKNKVLLIEPSTRTVVEQITS